MKPTAETRTSVARNFALIAPDGWVNSTLPGWSNCKIHVIINPAMGADFTQLLVFMELQSFGKGQANDVERFIYVMDGEGEVEVDGQKHTITEGNFAFIPAQYSFEIYSESGMKLTVFEKKYQPLDHYEAPDPIVSHENQAPSSLYMDDSQLHMQNLLPDNLSFDMAINIFTYDPGGNLPFVETHVMEHGLIYLAGQGIYKLGNQWFPVKEDDCIWMAPYCPQWFVAMGKEPAVYLYYKNVNRHPLD